MTPSLAIEAHGLVKHYGETVAVGGVDVAVPTGTVTSILGPNGAGKTTTVRMLTTLATPTAGTATVAGYRVREAASATRATGPHLWLSNAARPPVRRRHPAALPASTPRTPSVE